MSEERTIGLSLPDEQSEYQRLVRDEALAQAQNAGMKIEAFFAENRVMIQMKQLYNFIRGNAAEKLGGLIVMPVLHNSLDRFGRDAASASIPLVFLNRRPDHLDELRREFPAIPICFVSPDQSEIGRIQGRQVLSILPRGGAVLVVQGNAASPPAQARLAGMREVVKGSKIQELGVLDGNWNASDADKASSDWLRMMLPVTPRIDLVACHNDLMASGTKRSFSAAAAAMRRADLEKVPFIGCDGLPEFGQRLVRESALRATIVIPPSGGPAVEFIVKALKGIRGPSEVILPPAPYSEARNAATPSGD